MYFICNKVNLLAYNKAALVSIATKKNATRVAEINTDAAAS